jgi:hypothetical protein
MILPETVSTALDPERFYSSADLDTLSQDDIEELFSACPHKELYQQALEQFLVQNTAAHDGLPPVQGLAGTHWGDSQRIAAVETLLELAERPRPRLPVGIKQDGQVVWNEAPQRVRRSLEDNVPLATPLAAEKKKTHSLPLPLLAVAGVAGFCILASLINGAVVQPMLKASSLTATARALAPQTTTTPTPLALDNLDKPVGEGEDLRKRYPVILQISHPGSPDLVFPVQQKEVDIAEWKYAPQTDVASSLLGMSIRPVIGIPYSEASETYLKSLQAGDQIKLAMNSGQILLFTVQHSERVQRQNTGLFDQHTPGIVLLLLADPAPDRLAVVGTPVEIPATGATTGELIPPGAAHIWSENGLSVTVNGARLSPGTPDEPLPPDWSYLLVDLTLASSAAPVTLDLLNFELLEAGTGAHYSAARLSPSLAADPLTAQILPAANTLKATLGYLVPRTLDIPRLSVRFDTRSLPVLFDLQIAGASAATPDDLQVVLLNVETSPGELVVLARLYNPTGAQIGLDSQHLSVVYSPADSNASKQFPIGSPVLPTAPALPLMVAAGQSTDAELHFAWNGDAYAGLVIGGYQYVLTLAQVTTP